MNAIAALNILITLTDALSRITVNIQQVSALIQKAQAEGRDTFTEDEWKNIVGADDQARAFLADAIARALRRPA